jgi:hypothetical protein
MAMRLTLAYRLEQRYISLGNFLTYTKDFPLVPYIFAAASLRRRFWQIYRWRINYESYL